MPVPFARSRGVVGADRCVGGVARAQWCSGGSLGGNITADSSAPALAAAASAPGAGSGLDERKRGVDAAPGWRRPRRRRSCIHRPPHRAQVKKTARPRLDRRFGAGAAEYRPAAKPGRRTH